VGPPDALPIRPRSAVAVLLGVVSLVGVLVLWTWLGPSTVQPPTGDPSAGEETAAEVEAGEVVWAADFGESAWPDEYGVIGEPARPNAQVVPEGPDGRPDVLEVVFGEDGSRWGMDYRHSLDALGIPALEAAEFAYDVYFPEDFEFIGDGKLGGLAGVTGGLTAQDISSGGDYDERSFSVRAMWKADRGIVMYLYARRAAGRDFWDPAHYGFGIAERFVTEDGSTGGVLTPGTWHRIEHRVVLNTPGQRDGIYELRVDGHLGLALDDVEYRTEAHPDLAIDHIVSTWFFGGGSDQYPTRRNAAYTDAWELRVPR
jgi:hypothetical protein